ncbi:MAG TPA: hypothetical protein VFE47_22690 [Tepidisphaeraceae bacterium]|jgi:hypothetical protein|nr:hypothetical protein [Tepidisphaeraceae bacterium]
MSGVTLELQKALNQLDKQSAALLERLVRDALALVGQRREPDEGETDAMGWPAGHFKKYAGSLAGDDWAPPADPPAEPASGW